MTARLKNAGRAAGLPTHLVAELAGGSLPAGLVTGATEGGHITAQTHHTKVSTMHGYQPADPAEVVRTNPDIRLTGSPEALT